MKAQIKGINITGFGEFTYETAFGSSVDEDAAEAYEENGYFDEYSEKRNSLHFPGIALVFTSDMYNDKLSFLSEINFRTNNNAIDLGIERCYMQYAFNNYLNVVTGIYSAPIGYLNIHQRNHAYLNNSVHPRDMVNLKLGLIPTRIFGVKLDGSIEFGGTSSLQYVFSVGSGRSITPVGSPFEVDVFEDQESSLSLSGGLQLNFFMGETELNLGFSGYALPEFKSVYLENIGDEIQTSELDELLEGEDAGTGEEPAEAELVEYKESGIAPYIRLTNSKIEFITELHSTVMTGTNGPVEDLDFHYSGFSSELAYKTKLKEKAIMPYIRYDFINVPDNGGGPYLGLHEDGSELKRYFISNNSAIMVGVNWSVFSFNKIKIEYNRVLDGPQPGNAILIQSAFTF